ncbi:MAG: manganese efflux pump MntP family protein [Dehalococcoidales bacterium]|nr:manganese efflux pump MntP family protein [Dehalococcoidales bacterium]
MLDLLTILPIAFALSADCFAVSVITGISLKQISIQQMLRMSLSFGAFQALMPFLGWLAGQRILAVISDYDHWVAFGLLLFVGCRMIWESVHRKNNGMPGTDNTKGFTLLMLSLATSLDALAVGFSFSFADISISAGSMIIGVVSFAVTIFGLLLGGKLGKLAARRAEIIGGVILIVIGIRILILHMM